MFSTQGKMMQDTNALVDRFRQTFNQTKNEFDTQMRIQKENADANKEMAIYEKNMERQMKGLHPMMKEDTVKGMAPGQVGGMIGGASKEMGGKVVAPGQMDIMQKMGFPSGQTQGMSAGQIDVMKRFGIDVPVQNKQEMGFPSGQTQGDNVKMETPSIMSKMAMMGASQDGAKMAAQMAAQDAMKTAQVGVPKISGDVMLDQIRKGEPVTGVQKGFAAPAMMGGVIGASAAVAKMAAQDAMKAVDKGPAPMIKEEAVKAMAPGQMGGMIGGASKEMGGKVEMIGQGLGPKMVMDVATAKEVPMVRKEVENMPEAIAGKINPEVKKIVESFGKPERSEVEQKKMEVMEKLGVEPPKDANDMEDLRNGIYRPGGKEIPGTGVIESLIKDLQAFGSMLGKLTAGQQSGYTSGEMFGSSNFMILIALVTAIILASRR